MEASADRAVGIAHDFNNVFLVIRGHSGLLLSSLVDESARDSVREIEQAAARGVELARELSLHAKR